MTNKQRTQRDYFFVPKISHYMPSRDFKRTDRVGAELRREIGTLVHAAACATTGSAAASRSVGNH